MKSEALGYTERELVDLLLVALPTFGWKAQATGIEVPSHGRARADIALRVGDEVWAIEAKMSDWRKAIGQAVLNRYCFDRCYIALGMTKVTDHVRAEAAKWGVGVIGLQTGRASVVVEAEIGDPDEGLRGAVMERLARLRE